MYCLGDDFTITSISGLITILYQEISKKKLLNWKFVCEIFLNDPYVMDCIALLAIVCNK